MRVLIFILLLLGGGAALFYATHADRSAQHRAVPQLSTLRDTDDLGSGDNDEFAKLGADDPAAPALRPDDGTPPLAPVPSRQARDQAIRAEPPQGSSPNAPRDEQAKTQLDALRRSFAITMVRRRDEIRRASVDLASARDALQSVLKERGDLATHVLSLDAEAAKLRASAQTQTNELAAVRRSAAEQAERQTSAAGSARIDDQKQIASLQDKANGEIAREQETQADLVRSEALAGQLKTKLAELDALRQKTASQARDQLAEKDVAAGQRDASIAAFSQRLRVAETKVRDLTSTRDATMARMAHVTTQQLLAANGLLAAKVALTNASTRAMAQKRTADLAAGRVRQLTDENADLRRRAEAADTHIDDAKGALSRATTASAALLAQVQSLGSGQDRGKADLANARADNVRLAARLEADGAELQKKLIALRQKNVTLAGQAAQLPQLSHDLDDGRKRVAALEKMVGALKSQSGGQIARLDALTRTGESEQADRTAALSRNKAGLSEATRKLRLAEAAVLDLTASRDAAMARSARITTQRRLAASGLLAAKIALATTQQRPAAPARDSARADDDLTEVKSENARLAALLGTAAVKSDERLADLRQKNAVLAGQVGRLPQLAHDIDDGRAQLSALEKMVHTLKSENGEQRAHIDALKTTQKKGEDLLSQAETDRRATKAAEASRSQKLGRALASVSTELAQAVRAKETSTSALAVAGAKLEAERTRSASLSEKLATAERLSSQARKGPHPDDSGKKRESVALSRAPLETLVSPPPPVGAASYRGPTGLPDSVAAHVLLRYAHDGTRSQERAQALQATLRTLGVEVNDANARGTGKPGDSVTYFYAQDRSIADQVAQRIEAPAPVRSRGIGSKAPRPGTIEVSVGG